MIVAERRHCHVGPSAPGKARREARGLGRAILLLQQNLTGSERVLSGESFADQEGDRGDQQHGGDVVQQCRGDAVITVSITISR